MFVCMYSYNYIKYTHTYQMHVCAAIHIDMHLYRWLNTPARKPALTTPSSRSKSEKSNESNLGSSTVFIRSIKVVGMLSKEDFATSKCVRDRIWGRPGNEYGRLGSTSAAEVHVEVNVIRVCYCG